MVELTHKHLEGPIYKSVIADMQNSELNKKLEFEINAGHFKVQKLARAR